MKKSNNIIYSALIALLCASVLFFTACSDDDPETALPVIAMTTADQNLEIGETLRLEVVATGDALFYKWYKDGVEITENTTANTSQYTKLNIGESDAGSYTCKVSNSAGSVTSIPMIVTVKTNIEDNVENVLTSTSFEIVDGIQDSVQGYYQDHGNQSKGIYSAFTIKNKSNYSLRYYVKVEKIAMPDSNMAGICIDQCVNVYGKDLPQTRNFPNYNPNDVINTTIELAAGATTNRDLDSYIKLSAGNDDDFSKPVAARPGQTMLRVTYINAADETDFIRFKLYWNFTKDK